MFPQSSKTLDIINLRAVEIVLYGFASLDIPCRWDHRIRGLVTSFLPAVMFSRFIHVVSCVRISFFFMAE